MKKRILFFTVLLVTTSNLFASPAPLLNITQLDFGNPASPQLNAPRPGNTGVAYLTLENRSTRPVENLVLSLEKGNCLSLFGPMVRVSRLEAGQRKRLSDALQIQFDTNCRAGNDVSFLLIGAYQFAGEPQRRNIWITHHFNLPATTKLNKSKRQHKTTAEMTSP